MTESIADKYHNNNGNKRKRLAARVTAAYGALVLALIILVVLNTCIGTIDLSLEEMIRGLTHPEFSDSEMAAAALWKIRLPRLVAVLFLGGGLSISGFLLQTFFANPIAGPYVLGISSGEIGRASCRERV